MPKFNFKYATIFLIVFLDLLGVGIVLPLLPFYAEKFTSNAIIITSMVTAYSLMSFIFTPILGHFSDKYGRKPILIISQLGSAVGYLFLAFASNIYILFLSRIIDGITGGNISTAQAYITDISSKEERRKAFGIIGAAFGLGFMLGPTIGGLLGHINIMLPGIFGAVMATGASILVYLKLPETTVKGKEVEKYSFKQMFSVLKNNFVAKIIITSIFFGLAFSGMQSVFSLYNQKLLGFQERENGLLFGYIGLISILMQVYFLRKLEKKYGDKPLIKISLIADMIGLFLLFLMPFVQFKLLFLMLGITMFGFGNGIFNPTIRALLTKGVDQYGKYLGIFASYISLTMIFGPIISGFLYETVGPSISFLASSVLMLLGVISFWGIKIKE